MLTTSVYEDLERITFPTLDSKVPETGWSDEDIIGFINDTYEPPKILKEIEVKTRDEFRRLNSRNRRELELKIFDAYFSPKEDRDPNERIARFSRSYWLVGNHDIGYKLSEDVFFSLLKKPLTGERYELLPQTERKDIADFIEYCYLRRLEDHGFKTYSERISDMGNSIVVPYGNTHGFLDDEIIESVTKETIRGVLKEKIINMYSSLEIDKKTGKRIGVKKLCEEMGISRSTLYRWIKNNSNPSQET